ncbi:putative protein phosphatase 2C 25-like protein [Trifolium pratense]|uniref:Uncharacterized protein n=2 Tax=Trifolium pratense TaxID=57577 RepID=A0ACB0J7B4_TRIPR|nr:putative protein phosphatase 2C 25-like protein [Trifolium pratense]CAJ2640312.1 unnamed protein product [Trifolium pratense]
MSCSVAVSNSNVFSLSSPCHFSLPSPVLKRHRPAKLHIPVASLTVDVLTPVPETVPAKDVVEDEGIGFSVYCKKGSRKHMEDRYSASVNLHGESKQAFFGIFDGHGGTKASEFAAHNLENNVLEVIKSDYESDIEEAVKNGYLKTDSDFLKEDLNGGSCCVTALVKKGNLIVSNAGDCRAVISRGGVAEALTSDHKPSRIDEKERIETQGGYVDMCRGVWRIQGSLAVSRSIGDRHMKQYVIAEPETKVVKIESHHDLLILASDGLWEKVSNQEAVDIARSFCVGSNRQGPFNACKKLVDLSSSRGSIDDISVMIIELQNYI